MRVHGTSGGRERRRERRFGGSSNLFRPTTGTPTGCELFACDDAALIHGVKVEPMLKLEFELLVLNQIQEESTRIANQGFLQAYSPDPPRPQTRPHKASRIRLLSSLARLPSLLVLRDVARDARRGFPRHSRRWSVGGYRRDLHVSSIEMRTIFAPASRSSSRRRGARGAFVGGRGERGERICRQGPRVRCLERRQAHVLGE